MASRFSSGSPQPLMLAINNTTSLICHALSDYLVAQVSSTGVEHLSRVGGALGSTASVA